ncbi:hypothetical protein HYPSUDRAFT_59120 [Hypholoma sublateritium FD-334 SS-4]|uniref:Uncharacterized protein n=1 Tax=Hypholoma sublateritium (strain FD-334 SS-4) TaxID=945553 RepID=A0A0D2LVN3_HYPSF|nr:hypothetical protein HYPSUDRAFT_59120 [Hypholoma sublateritium FD-334 SS-4]
MTNLGDYLGCFLTEVNRSGVLVISGAGCPLHDGAPYIIPGCKLHNNRPPPGTIIAKSIFNHYKEDQVVGQTLSDLAAQFAAGHPSETEANQPAPVIPTVPNTPQSTPTRSASLNRPLSLTGDLAAIDWAAVAASANYYQNYGSGSDHSSEEKPPPPLDPLELWGPPPPSPTESQIDSNWPTKSRAQADEGGTQDDVDSDFDSDINPDDFDDYDYSRPPLWTPAFYRPSSNVECTHWYDAADVLYAEAEAAVELHDAREWVAATAAALVASRAAADAATIAAFHAAQDSTQDAAEVHRLGLDMAKAEAEAASRAVEAADAAAAEARAQEHALAMGIDVDVDTNNRPEGAGNANPETSQDVDNDLESDGDSNENGYISTLPWGTSGYWSVHDQIRVLGEPYSEYSEH